jgi:hypothetical protein
MTMTKWKLGEASSTLHSQNPRRPAVGADGLELARAGLECGNTLAKTLATLQSSQCQLTAVGPDGWPARVQLLKCRKGK